MDGVTTYTPLLRMCSTSYNSHTLDTTWHGGWGFPIRGPDLRFSFTCGLWSGKSQRSSNSGIHCHRLSNSTICDPSLVHGEVSRECANICREDPWGSVHSHQ